MIAALFLCIQTVEPATYTVTNTGDNGGVNPAPGAGTGTLRQAIIDANLLTPGIFDMIVFNIGPGGFQSIQPLTQLPDLTDVAGTLIDGFTQPGGAGAGSNPPATATLLIEINGSLCLPPLNPAHGFVLRSPNNTIRGLIINRFSRDGILIPVLPTGVSNNLVYCNFIGTDQTGNINMGNGWDLSQLWAGVYIGSLGMGTAFQNVIDGNLISGNYAEGVGIMSCPTDVDVFQNQVINNYIGTDITGMLPLGNVHDGVYIGEGAHHNLVDGNLISANGFEGVCIVGYPPNGWDSHSNTVSNNIIGLNINLFPLPNASDGVSIGIYGANQNPQFFTGGFATWNTVGPGNIIASNGRNGVLVWEMNDGLNINADKNRITQNHIYNNNLLGIDLGDDLVTPNDATDPDKGPNQQLNFPYNTGAVLFGGQTTVSGMIDIDSNPLNAIVELFSLNVPDPSGFGEGDNFLVQVIPAANGSWTTTLPSMPLGSFISANVTDINNNTSEFSVIITVANTVNTFVTTNPTGLNFSVDGINYTSQQLFTWLPFSNHTLATFSPQNVTTGSRMNFTGWSDGGTLSHNINISLVSTTYVANFTQQYRLTTNVIPTAGGTIITNPAGPWINSGDLVTITASPSPGYLFSGWNGSLSGNTNPTTFTMNSPMSVTANFIIAPLSVVSTNPSVNAINVNKASDIVVTFDQPVNLATLNGTTFSVSGHLKGSLTGTYTLDASGKTATFNPINNFADGETISISLMGGIKSVAGSSLAPYSFSFTVQASNPTKMSFLRNDQSVSEPGTITSGDFNNDGWVDAAVYTWLDFNTKVRVGIMLNNQGTLQPPVNYTRNKTQYLSPGKIYSFDVDRDGDVDIVLTEMNDAGGYMNIAIMKNNGNGAFAAPSFYPAYSTSDLAFADLNNDGFIDILGNMVGDMNKVGVFMNDGTGKFNTSTTYNVGYYPKYPFIGDFNNDGYNDFAVLIVPNNNYQVAVMLNNRNGTFGSLATYPVNIGQAMTLKGGDFDANGYVDLVCCGDLGYRINVLLNNKNGTFAPQTEYFLPSTHWPKDIICTDIDGDTDIDIVANTRESFSGNLVVMLNNGYGRFQYFGYTTTHYLQGILSFADFDNDGDVDPIILDYGGWVSVFKNTGVPELDFGDAPDPTFPTLLMNNGARHMKRNDLYLGNSVDTEADGQPDASALGDDLNGTPDDENGITFSLPLIPGTTDSVFVHYINYMTNYNVGYLNAWIDFNQDGDWDDNNEQIITNFWLYYNQSPVYVPFSIPSGCQAGSTYARFRLSSMSDMGVKYQAPDGEVEDYKIMIGKYDFGDAPDPTYPTLQASNGARHIIDGQVWLGAGFDPEADGLQSADALGDDNNNIDDEDGIIFSNTLSAGGLATIQVTASVAGKLNAWFDFNIDGDWSDSGEQIFTNTALAAGVNNLSFAIPSNTTADTTYARFRFNTTGGLSYTGEANNGEVEDYRVVINPAGTTWNEGFEGYTLGSDIVGQGGWEFWGGASSSSFARITGTQFYSGTQALQIRGVSVKEGGKSVADDIVHQYAGCENGVWQFVTWQFIPTEASGGTTYLVLLNQYDPGGTNNNWSTQVKFDPDENIVESEFDGVTLPLVKGSWAKICITIDLDNDLQTISYNGKHLITKSWTNGMNSAGVLNIAAVDLYANTLSNVDVYYDECSLRSLDAQLLDLTDGWNSLSGYIEPTDPGVDVVLGPVANSLTIFYNLSGVYWPGQNMNTLGDYNIYSGYAIKMSADENLSLCGNRATNRLIGLNQGWNLIPVITEEACSIESLFEDVPGFSVAKELAGSGVYWKDYQINTIGCLQPGKAYFVKMNEADSIDFDLVNGCQKSYQLQTNGKNSHWNSLVCTPSSHIVVFNLFDNPLLPGDIIGGFTPEGFCAGRVEVADINHPFAICLFGDDGFAKETSGFITGQEFIFRLYRPSTGETTSLLATYNPEMTPGIFEENGLSEITHLSLLTTTLADLPALNLTISPNPSSGIFRIGGADLEAQIHVFSAFGMEILDRKMMLPATLNLMDQPSGAYYIRIESEKGSFTERLIVF